MIASFIGAGLRHWVKTIHVGAKCVVPTWALSSDHPRCLHKCWECESRKVHKNMNGCRPCLELEWHELQSHWNWDSWREAAEMARERKRLKRVALIKYSQLTIYFWHMAQGTWVDSTWKGTRDCKIRATGMTADDERKVQMIRQAHTYTLHSTFCLVSRRRK